jgi:hypothetical protein
MRGLSQYACLEGQRARCRGLVRERGAAGARHGICNVRRINDLTASRDLLKSSPDPSFPYETARHTDVQRAFARVEWQRLEERRTGRCLGVLGGRVAILFREQALKARSSPPDTTNTTQSGPAPSPRVPFHHG